MLAYIPYMDPMGNLKKSKMNMRKIVELFTGDFPASHVVIN